MKPIQSIFIMASLCVLASAYEKPCMYKGKPYKDGQTFKEDCNECKCDDGNAVCTKKACPKEPCTYEGKPYKHGQTFKDDCNDCKCDDGKVECSKRACPKRCSYDGEYYDEGDNVKSKDKCKRCYCRNGSVNCTPVVCPPCKGYTPPGACCPICDN